MLEGIVFHNQDKENLIILLFINFYPIVGQRFFLVVIIFAAVLRSLFPIELYITYIVLKSASKRSKSVTIVLEVELIL
jgi:hypothetical protein